MSRNEGISVGRLVVQVFLISAIFGLWSSPAIQPVKIMVVLFHELSHGLMALATGGEVLAIEITQDEGGLCESLGGNTLLIVSAGYLGSMFFGGLLLYLSKFRDYVPAIYTMLTLVLAVAIFTVLEDPYTRNFATVLAGVFVFLGLLAPTLISALFLQLIGTVSCLYSLFDIYGDVLAPAEKGPPLASDAMVFSQETGIPPSVVGLAWLLASLVYFVFVLRVLLLKGEDTPAPAGVPEPA